MALPTTTVSGTKWSVSSSVAVTDDLGHQVSGAQVTVRITTTGRRGTSVSTVTVTADGAGVATITGGPYGRSGSQRIDSVDIEVVGVIAGGGPTWDGSASSVRATRP